MEGWDGGREGEWEDGREGACIVPCLAIHVMLFSEENLCSSRYLGQVIVSCLLLSTRVAIVNENEVMISVGQR